MNRTPANILFYSGLGWVGLMMLSALAAPFMSPYDPAFIDIRHLLEAPSGAHWMGTDQLGRDVLSRMIYGARISLSVGFVAVGISTVIGVMIGADAGYAGGRLDRFLMAVVDIMLCFPVSF